MENFKRKLFNQTTVDELFYNPRSIELSTRVFRREINQPVDLSSLVKVKYGIFRTTGVL